MQLKFTFSNPLELSAQEGVKDYIQIIFKNDDLINGGDEDVTLAEEDRMILVPIPRQFQDGVDSEAVEVKAQD